MKTERKGVSVHEFAALPELSRAAADAVAAIISAAITARGRAFVALSGGATPKAMFGDLAQRQIDWSRVSLFWSDERSVPPVHKDSNYRMAKEALLDKLPRAAAVERMHGENPDLKKAAADYAAVIARDLPGAAFDLILLGMGPDGHTASLFPGTAALADDEHLVVSNVVPQQSTTRLTFTYKLINAARHVLFLVAGADKAAALRKILAGGSGLPAEGVTAADVQFFVDQAAAGFGERS